MRGPRPRQLICFKSRPQNRSCLNRPPIVALPQYCLNPIRQAGRNGVYFGFQSLSINRWWKWHGKPGRGLVMLNIISNESCKFFYLSLEKLRYLRAFA